MIKIIVDILIELKSNKYLHFYLKKFKKILIAIKVDWINYFQHLISMLIINLQEESSIKFYNCF
jgi:hypothetical protein